MPLKPRVVQRYDRQVTFTKAELAEVQEQLPEGHSLDLSRHNSFHSKAHGERLYVPFYASTGAFQKPKELGRTFSFSPEKESLAWSRGITRVHADVDRYSEEMLFHSGKMLVPFFAVKGPEGSVSGRVLVRPQGSDFGPKPLHWESLSRGAAGEPLHFSPAQFEDEVGKRLSSLGKSRVLVVGPGFGLSLPAMHKKHPQAEFVGLDVRDWPHALPATCGIGASREDVAYARSHTVIADASPIAVPNGVPFKDSTFDLVVMHPAVFPLLGHPVLTLSELMRVSKKGGRIMGDFDLHPAEFAVSKSRYYQKGLVFRKQADLKDALRTHFGATVSEKLIPTVEQPRRAFSRFWEISGWKTHSPAYSRKLLKIGKQNSYTLGVAENEYVFPRNARE